METLHEEIDEREKISEIENASQTGQALILEQPISKPSIQGRRNPPARNTSRFWFERFLAVIQRQNPSVIDSSFLSQIAPSNEGKLLAQLKFMHVIDEQGKPTPLLHALNMLGDEQKKGFQQVVRESYSDLLAEVKIERALPQDLLNFFIRKYQFPRDKALNASKFFLYLTEKGGILVSPELSSLLVEKSNTSSLPPSSSAAAAAPGLPERNTVLKEVRNLATSSIRLVGPKKQRGRAYDGENQSPSIQATINITLDKDTPKEYWDRVLALLGESRESAQLGFARSEVEGISSSHESSQSKKAQSDARQEINDNSDSS